MPQYSPSLLRAALGVVFALSLSACPRNDDQTQQASPSPAASTAASAAVPASQAPVGKASGKPIGKTGSQQAAANVRRGIFVFGEDYRIFKPCGSSGDIWVKDTPGKDLEKRYKALKLLELEPVYVELTGSIGPTGSTEGFAADYKQTLQAAKVTALRPWVSDGSCFPTDFVAQGSPPDWSLQILRGSDVFFKSHEGEFPYVDTLAYSPPKQEGNRWLYTFSFRTPDEEKLQAEFSEEACSHAGKDYPFTAKVQFRGVTYSGCASKLK